VLRSLWVDEVVVVGDGVCMAVVEGGRQTIRRDRIELVGQVNGHKGRGGSQDRTALQSSAVEHAH
jgi:hypothetical protein